MPFRPILLTLLLASTAFAAPTDPVTSRHYESGRSDGTKAAAKNYFLILFVASPQHLADQQTISVLRKNGINPGFYNYEKWPAFKNYCLGYNETTKLAIEDKLGADIWKRIEREVRETIKPASIIGEAPIYEKIRGWSEERVATGKQPAAPLTPPTQADEQYFSGRFAANLMQADNQYTIQVFEMGEANEDFPSSRVLGANQIGTSGRGCVRWTNEADYYRGYNEVTKPAIEARYGKDIWKRLAAESKIALEKANWKDRPTPIYDLLTRWANEP